MSAMQGWRISMEDAHAAVLDLQAEDADKGFVAASPEDRLSFFGVYDGHGGDKVALFAGENIHKILAKQEAFKKKDFEQALKDGFLATDRAILSGEFQACDWKRQPNQHTRRSKIRGRGFRLHRICGFDIENYDIRGKFPL